MRINNTRPAKAPNPAGRQPRTVATASTIVSASTASTSEAKNAAVTAGPMWAQLPVTGCLRKPVLLFARSVGRYGPPLKLAVDHQYVVPEFNHSGNGLARQRRAEDRDEHEHRGESPPEEGLGESPAASAAQSNDAHRFASTDVPQNPWEQQLLAADSIVSLLRQAAMLRAGGAMNSGPTGSVIVSRRIRSISALAEASSRQPVTSSTGCSCSGCRAPHSAVVIP